MTRDVLDTNRLAKLLDGVQPTSSSAPMNITINYTVNVNGTSPIPSQRGDKMKTFVVLSPGEDGYIVAECPTLPGCVSQGQTREEAIDNIKEAIELMREVRHDLDLPEFEVVELEV